MEISPTIPLLAVAAFGACVWFWRVFDWRWYPGVPMLLGGLLLAGFTGGFCVLSEPLPYSLGCRAAYATRGIGLALGLFAAGCLVLICSPAIAFWRRARAEARREA